MKIAMLYADAYVYMARVPSELLKWQWGGSVLTSRSQAAYPVSVQANGVEVRVHIAQRKNARLGDTIRRVCSCEKSKALCPVHSIGDWLADFKVGEFPFLGISPGMATRRLRADLRDVGVADYNLFSLHSFRRGAAQDMSDMGCTLQELLDAGGWSSRACFAYLRPQDLDLKAVIRFVVDGSDSESED